MKEPPLQISQSSVASVDLPSASGVATFYPSTDLADAYAVRLPSDAIRDPERLARFVFEHQPPWAMRLMKVRDALVAGLGLKTSKQLNKPQGSAARNRVGIFRIYERRPNELIMGEDDKHLDFRISVLCAPVAADANTGTSLIVSTVVHCHNLLGRSYIALITPFHRLILKACLRRAARIGWPIESAT